MPMDSACIDHGCKGFGLGYATAWLVKDGRKCTTTKHRKLYYEATGEWPEVVRHKCDNPRCINIAHLEGGTAVDNMRDCKERGRLGDARSFGERNGRAVLTNEDVGRIRSMYVKNCRYRGAPALARMFNCGATQINRIVRGVQRAQAS